MSATAGSARGTIADDDAAAADIALTLGPASVAEDAGPTTVTVTATLAGTITRNTATAVAVAVAAGTAVAVTDFAAVAPFTVTIAAESLTGTATFEFAPADDAADEPEETVTVSGTATDFTVAPAQLAIADDDPPTVVRVTGTDGEYIAGDVVPVEVTFSSAVAVDTASGAPRLLLETGTTDRHAAYAGGTGTATLRFDYTVQAGDAAADLEYVGTGSLAGNGGSIRASADSLDAVLTLPALASTGSLAGSGAVVVDTAKSRTFSIAAARGDEGDGIEFTVTLARAGQPRAASVAYTVAKATGDTADEGADFDAVAVAATLAFGATETARTFTVATRQDLIDEDDETFTATLSGASAGTAVSATDGSARGTIADDDAAAADIALTLGPASVAEDAGPTTVTVTATLAGTITRNTATAVAVAVAAGTAVAVTDFAAVAPFTVTIDAESLTGTATFEFAPADDAADEPEETVTVSGTATDFTVAPAQLAIADDDPPTVVRVTGTDGEYIAGDVVPVAVTFSSAVAVDTASGAPRLLLETGTTDRHAAYAGGTGTATLRFDYTVQAGDAAADLEYVGTGSLAGNGGSIRASADGLDAVLTLPALASTGSLAGSGAVVVDTAKSRTFSIAAVAAADEGDPVAFTVTLARAGQPLAASVGYTVASAVDDTATADADYTPAPATLAFGETDTARTFTVATVDDLIDEDDETFTATLSGASAGTAVSATAGSARGTIADDDAAAADIALTLGPASVAEDAGPTTVTVTATLAGTITRNTATAVAVAVAAGTAVAVTDFAAVAPFTVTIAAESLTGTATFEFAPADDAADEPEETVTVSGTATDFTVAPAQLAIADDDPPTVVRVTGTDGEYIAGDVVPVAVTFSSAVAVDTASGAPRLLLETGTTDRHAAYAGGTGTATLRFDYTVQAGDAAADLEYVGTGSLAGNGGSIRASADSLDAVLTLPALASTGSLAGSGAVVVDTAKSRTFSIAAARGGRG